MHPRNVAPVPLGISTATVDSRMAEESQDNPSWNVSSNDEAELSGVTSSSLSRASGHREVTRGRREKPRRSGKEFCRAGKEFSRGL